MTGWCRVSFWMVKVSRAAHRNARRASDACSEQRPVRRTTRSGRNPRTENLLVLARFSTHTASTMQMITHYMSESISNIISSITNMRPQHAPAVTYSHHRQDNNTRPDYSTKYGKKIRERCNKPIAPGERAQNSAQEAVFGSS